jgi:curved DNA-binding protein CbpA
MSCDCAQCRQHYRTLGIAFGIPEESAIEEAYREGVKQWHPDLYENYASLRADAEEHFKQIQVAYRELKEHNTIGAEVQVESAAVEPTKAETPALSFGGAPGCLTAEQFNFQVQEMVAPHLGRLGPALAIVDLAGGSHNGNYHQFLLLATRGIMMRDARGIISLIWYADLGEIKLIDRHKSGKVSSWQKLMGGISGSQSNSILEINRSDGANFYSISGQVEDSAKTAIYNFLVQQKAQAHP